MPQQYPSGYQPYYDDLSPQYPTGYQPYIPYEEPTRASSTIPPFDYTPPAWEGMLSGKPYTSPGTTVSKDTYQPGFWPNVAAFPSELLSEINTRAKKTEAQLHEGDYPGAFHTMGSFITDPIQEVINTTGRFFSGKPPLIPMSPEMGKRGAIGTLAGAAGLPSEGFQQAIEHQDIPGLAGQIASAAGTIALTHRLGSGKLGPEIPPEHIRSVPAEPLPERFGFRPPSDFGMDMSAFESKPPTPSTIPPLPSAFRHPDEPMGYQPLIEPDRTPYRQGEPITLPTDEVTPEIVQNLADEGYVPHQQGDETVFSVESRRPPGPEDPRFSDVMGRVAPFEPPSTREHDFTETPPYTYEQLDPRTSERGFDPELTKLQNSLRIWRAKEAQSSSVNDWAGVNEADKNIKLLEMHISRAEGRDSSGQIPGETLTPEIKSNLQKLTDLMTQNKGPRPLNIYDKPVPSPEQPFLPGTVQPGIRERAQLDKIGNAKAPEGMRLGLDEQGELFPQEPLNLSKGPLQQGPRRTNRIFGVESSRIPFNERLPKQPLQGGEEIPDLAFQPDEGVSTNREWAEHFLPGEKVVNPLTRKEINETTQTAPEGRLNEIADQYPDILDEAKNIYNEKDARKISENLRSYSAMEKEVQKKWMRASWNQSEHKIPIPDELRAAHGRITSLMELAQAKYERASFRQLEGQSIESRRPTGPLERDEFGNPIFKHDTPIQVRFEKGLENAKAKDWGDTRFLLPDGTRKTHDARTHAEAARRLGVGLGQALRSGIVRVTDDFDGIHVSSPITDAQAQVIADAMYFNRFKRIYVDLYDQNQHLKTRDFTMGASADSIRKWINDKFREPSTESVESRRFRDDRHPIAIRFDKKLPDAKSTDWRDTRFLLPDGTRKTHNEITHEIASQEIVKVPLYDAMREGGVVRVAWRFHGVEIHHPITHAQAEVIADSPHYSGGDYVYAEVYGADGRRQLRQFDRDNTAGQVHEWVNRQFEQSTESRRPSSDNTPIIIKFDKRLKDAKEWHETRFVLPDGTRKTHNKDTHYDAAESIDSNLYDALAAGIVRVSPTFESAEIHHPITSAQAEVLADMALFNRRQGWQFEVNPSGDTRAYNQYVHKYFDKDAKASQIREWVNNQFKTQGTESRIGQALRDKTGDFIEKKTTDILIGQEGKGFNRNSIIEGSGSRFTKADLEEMKNIPMVREVHQLIDQVIHEILPPEAHGLIRSTGTTLRNDIYGVVNRLLGSDRGSILINMASHIEDTTNPIEAARRMMVTIFHEAAHVNEKASFKPFDETAAINDPYLAGFARDYLQARKMNHQPTQHGADWLGRMADLYERNGRQFASKYENKLADIFEGSNKRTGTYGPEAKKVLSVYFRRTRPRSTRPSAPAGEGIESTAAPRPGGTIPSGDQTGGGGPAPKQPEGIISRMQHQLGWGQGGSVRSPEVGKAGSRWLDEALGLSKAATTVGDYSATLKQGLPSITTKEFWKALVPMVRAGWDKSYSDSVMAEIRRRPLFERMKDRRTQRILPSIAEEMGFRFIENTKDLSKRSELIASNWIENGRFFGMSADNPLAKVYSQTLGRFTRGSNRAFATLINHIGANRLEFLFDRAVDMSSEALRTGRAPRTGILGGVRLGDFDIGLKRSYSPEEAKNLNPYKNIVLGKEITDFVRTSLGQAPLRTHILPFRQAELNLEANTKALTRVLFAPRLIASRVRMLNPSTYVMASPYVRKQYMKAMLSTALAWGAVTKMAQLSGMAKVNWDPDNSDFGKMKSGNTRFDLGASFLPYLVAAHRLYSGRYVSSATGQAHRYGAGFQAETQWSQLERFGTNKLEPLTKFAYDLLNASEYQPFHVTDRAAQLFLPLTVQDLIEIFRESPELLPVGIPAAILGAGSQTYQKGETTGKIIPSNREPFIIKHPSWKGMFGGQ